MLAEDSLLLISASEAQTYDDLANSMARAAVLDALVLPEVVANCCIDNLGLPNATYKEIDRLSVISKFDFYLRTKFRSKYLDRGALHVQALSELKKLRDDYVHPKLRRIAWIGAEDGMQSAERPITPMLGIAKNPRDWWHHDAILAVRATHSFFKYFFLTCCHYNKSTVASLLSGDSEAPERGNFYVPYLRKSMRTDLNRWGIDLSYVKHGWL